jgi:hypothetical protein
MHGTTNPKFTAHIAENLKKLNFEVLEHPIYSLDLTSLD